MTKNVDDVNNNILDNKNNHENKYLIFESNKILYGIDIANVLEIIEYKMPTKVPNVPPFVHGLLNLRGKVLPIIDFNLYLGDTGITISKKTCAIIIDYLFHNQLTEIGILVDNVLDVIAIESKILEKPIDFGVNIKPEFVKNMVILNNQIIILLNINNIFINQIVEQS